jgi:thioredoxin-like negative regulator of GroEL
MLKLIFFYKENESQSKIQEEFIKNIEIIFKGKLEIERLDVEKNQKTAKDYGVNEIPMIILENNGKITDRFTGFTQELFLKRAIQSNL